MGDVTLVGLLITVISSLIGLLLAILAYLWKRQTTRIDAIEGMKANELSVGSRFSQTLSVVEKHQADSNKHFDRLYERDQMLTDALHKTNQTVASVAATIAAQQNQVAVSGRG